MPDVGSRDHGSRREPSSDEGAGVAPLDRSGAKSPAGRPAERPDPGSGPGPAAGDSPPASDPLETVDYPEVAADGRSIPGYRLIRVLGEGGMGVVHLAEERGSLQRLVAIKIVRPERADTESAIRFENEAQILAQLEHPGIARIYAAGRFEGRPYYAMEYIQGEPITDWCARHDVPLKERHSLFISVCDAMAFVHDRQVIHRDLKPSNILVSTASGRPVVKIIDFGVAKTLVWHANTHPVHTEAGRAVGTPYYMSPEQVSGGVVEVDARSDVYALGVLLYELTTGEHPLDTIGPAEPSTGTLRTMIRLAPPEPPSRVLERRRKSAAGPRGRATTRAVAEPSDVKGALEAVILRALAKRPKDRYQSAAELARDLERFRAGHPVLARPRSRLRAALDRLRYDPKRRRVALLALGLTLVTGIAIAAWKGATWLGEERYFENVTRAAALIDEGNIAAAREIVSELRTKKDAFELDVLESRIESSSIHADLDSHVRHLATGTTSTAIAVSQLQVGFIDVASGQVVGGPDIAELWLVELHPEWRESSGRLSPPQGALVDFHWLTRLLAIYDETPGGSHVILHDLANHRALRLASWKRDQFSSWREVAGRFSPDGLSFRWSLVPGLAPREPRCGSWALGRFPSVEERAELEHWLPELALVAARGSDRLELRCVGLPEISALLIESPGAQDLLGYERSILIRGKDDISIHDRSGGRVSSVPAREMDVARLSDDGTLFLWSRGSKVSIAPVERPLRPLMTFTDGPPLSTDLRLSDGRLFAAGDGGEVRIWDLERAPGRVIARDVLKAIPCPDGDGLLIASAEEGGGSVLVRRDMASGREQTVARIPERVRAMEFGSSGEIWIGAERLWRVEATREGAATDSASVRPVPGQPPGRHWGLAVAADAPAGIFASRNPQTEGWEVWLLGESGEFELCEHSGPLEAPMDLAITADGRLAYCRLGSSLLRIESEGAARRIVDLASACELGLDEGCGACAIGRSDGFVEIFDRAGRRRARFLAHPQEINKALWIDGATRLLTRGAEGGLRLWNPWDGRRILDVAGDIETAEVHLVPRSRVLLSVDADQSLQSIVE